MNLEGKRVCVIGGTGSFGNALLDHLKDSGARLMVFSRDETKQHEMMANRKGQNIEYVVGDIRDKDKLLESLKGVDYVFHAGALKHVPTGELYPEEVIHTNILGTKNVVEAAEYCKVSKLVFLSTDKAAYPISAYGGSKFMAEKLVMASNMAQKRKKRKTVNVCLRYGNVLGSRGSVVPIFLEQIRLGNPITITNSSMTRFILTLKEAVTLSLKCLNDGNAGDLFIMKPPACTIATLVQALELHYGRVIPQTIIGIRPGEKMHEVLLTGDEVYRSVEEHEGGITFARIAQMDNNKDFFKGEDYVEPPDYSSANSYHLEAREVLNKLIEAKLL